MQGLFLLHAQFLIAVACVLTSYWMQHHTAIARVLTSSYRHNSCINHLAAIH
jgi:hypothetical protein